MTAAAYDAIADWYDESVRNGALIHEFVFPTLHARFCWVVR